MRRIAAVVLTVAGTWAFTVGSAAAKPSSDAQKAFAVERTVVNQLVTGQAGKAWTHLVPAEQALISKTAYIACRSIMSIGTLQGFTLVDSYREQVMIPGTNVTTASIALVAHVTLASGPSQTFTAHLAKVGKSWRYMLAPAEFARCHA
jgi:hypothetical protein